MIAFLMSAVLVACGGAAASGKTPHPRAFERLPILEGGRVKPIDTFARNALTLISGKQSHRVDGHRRRASEWLLQALFDPGAADAQAVFLIDEPEILDLLRLPHSQRRFSFLQIEPNRARLGEAALAASELPARSRSRFQSASIAAERRLRLYESIRDSAAMHPGSPAFLALAPQRPDGAWSTLSEGLLRVHAMEPAHPGLIAFSAMQKAYRAHDFEAFDAALKSYADWLAQNRPADARRAAVEWRFNSLQPFMVAMTLHVAAFLLLAFSWTGGGDRFYRLGISLAWTAALVHSSGLFARMAIQGRPPVTNLYSSAVFVGWVASLLGLACERFHRRGLAAAAAACTGFLGLLVAHNLQAGGDTMEMMQAVLDSNFWLATHVVTITIGYSSTYLAGLAGAFWVLRQRLGGRSSPADGRALYSLAYGAVAFSLLFSFIGTVLGGIWADQSWGRFWGWDPKENGALLLVLWHAALLHARWAGFAGERGFMLLSIFGGIVVTFSWFGVNMLGVGLHSYGFMENSLWWLAAFCAGQLGLIAVGLAPQTGRSAL